MKLTHGQVFSALLLLTIVVSSLIFLSENVIQFVYWFKYLLRNSVENINESMNEENEELDRLKSQMDTMNETSIESRMSDLSRMRRRIKDNLIAIRPFVKYVENLKLDESFFFTYIEASENLYAKYIKYLGIKQYNDTLCSFAHTVTSNKGGKLGDILRRIEKHVLPEAESLPYGNFFSRMRNFFMKQDAKRCEQVSIQQNIYEMYELLILNEKIAYLVYKFSYSTLSQCSKGNYTSEMESVREGIIRRIQKYRKLILIVIADLPREVRCETRPYFRNEDFFEIERVVEPISNNCLSTCNSISEKTIPEIALYSGDIINITSCDTCKTVNSSQHCQKPTRFSTGKSERNSSSHPLYRFVVSSLLCDSFSSKGKEVYSYVHDYLCSDCVCKCTNPDVNIRYPYVISLRPQESDIAGNMIVTGIRFHKINNSYGVEVIYPQIKVAKLSPEGLSGEVWKDVGNFDNGPWPSGEAGVDYAFIGEGENQSMTIKLDDNREKSGYVVTGVKFQLRYDRYREKRYEGDIEKSFGIVVRLTPCDFTTGNLSESQSIYTDPNAEVAPVVNNEFQSKMPTKIRIGIIHKDHPITGENARPDLKIHHVEIFDSSESIPSKRITTSYFDLSSVEPNPAFPLSAINLFFKSVSPTRNFFAFKVITVNITELMESQRYEKLSSI